jgi:hypothetical protein
MLNPQTAKRTSMVVRATTNSTIRLITCQRVTILAPVSFSDFDA